MFDYWRASRVLVKMSRPFFHHKKKEAVFLIVDHNMVLLEGFGKPQNISKLIMVEMPANKSPKNINVAVDWR